MKIAFLGKGGSGKSTMATAAINTFLRRGFNVLAIDADHNMDLTYNLNVEPKKFLGSDPNFIKEYVGSSRDSSFKSVLEDATGHVFSISPPDDFTKDYAVPVVNNLQIMTAGPHTNKVRSGEACSHSLAAPLKVYLPLLRLNSSDVVVIDERAGTDPVATGILSAVDLVVIVRENTVNSQRVAEQIKNELELANISFAIFDNKVKGVEQDSEKLGRMLESVTI